MNKLIINDIDVSECRYLNKVVNEEPYCNIDEEHLYTCSSDENCYFKQLKRLQEENEELKQQLETDKNQINYFIEENEGLKEKIKSEKYIKENALQEATKYSMKCGEFRQALEGIRKILCNGRTFYEGYFDTPNLSRTDEAIKIINEVLNDRN